MSRHPRRAIAQETPYRAAFLTSPAPNRGAIRDPAVAARIPEVLRLRGNEHDAHEDGHGAAHGSGLFAGRFEHVVFAVWDTAPGAPRHAAFQRILGQSAGSSVM